MDQSDEIVSQQHSESLIGFAPRRFYHYFVNKNKLYTSEFNGLESNIAAMNSNQQQQQTATLGECAEKTLKTQKDLQKNNTTSVELNSSVSILELDNTVEATNGDSLGVLKTPVSILQEILSKRGIMPHYELVQIEGVIHEPTFRYRVSFIDNDVSYTAMGVGRSKQEAKHSAARAVMEKLLGKPTCEITEAINVAVEMANVEEVSIIEQGSGGDGKDKLIDNPVGWLQEMCMSRRWPPPAYAIEKEVGLPHERIFTVACTILKYREEGKGKSKKIAKRLAAHNMWNRLGENPIEYKQILENFQVMHDDEILKSKQFYGDLKNASVPTITRQHSDKVSQFHNQLKDFTGKKLLQLQTTCLNEKDVDFPTILQEIADENKFEITFVDIEEKTFDDEFQCLLQLSTLPVAVCHGTAITRKYAQSKAAMNALQYLKIMSKK